MFINCVKVRKKSDNLFTAAVLHDHLLDKLVEVVSGLTVSRGNLQSVTQIHRKSISELFKKIPYATEAAEELSFTLIMGAMLQRKKTKREER